jgi:hypothetical protein
MGCFSAHVADNTATSNHAGQQAQPINTVLYAMLHATVLRCITTPGNSNKGNNSTSMKIKRLE